MRLWHYKLISCLPDTQLLAQWRELNSIYKKQDKHLLINYIYKYPKENLYVYSLMVVKEMRLRGIHVKTWELFDKYFDGVNPMVEIDNPFPNHHNSRYLLQCFYNLQEKFDRHQRDFKVEQMNELQQLVMYM